MQLHPPAKINLSFRILRRRGDGFHEVETLIAPITLCDELTVELNDAPGIRFTCDEPALCGDDNLVVLAAREFFERTNVEPAATIALKKNIPHGAGLGGGSSDAASTLVGLNELHGNPLALAALSETAGAIGSDVPFFLQRSPAICRGRGEMVEPVCLPQQLALLLLKPSFGVATSWAYSRWSNSREHAGVSYAPQQIDRVSLQNDLERPVFEKFVFLATIKTWLLRQTEVAAALMSGSGSTLFAVLHSAADGELLARRARAELDPQLWTCACETLGG